VAPELLGERDVVTVERAVGLESGQGQGAQDVSATDERHHHRPARAERPQELQGALIGGDRLELLVGGLAVDDGLPVLDDATSAFLDHLGRQVLLELGGRPVPRGVSEPPAHADERPVIDHVDDAGVADLRDQHRCHVVEGGPVVEPPGEQLVGLVDEAEAGLGAHPSVVVADPVEVGADPAADRREDRQQAGRRFADLRAQQLDHPDDPIAALHREGVGAPKV
jgi:hypothetical protein